MYVPVCLLSLTFFHIILPPKFIPNSDMTISKLCVPFLGTDKSLDCAFIPSERRETQRTRNTSRKHTRLLSQFCCTHIVFPEWEMFIMEKTREKCACIISVHNLQSMKSMNMSLIILIVTLVFLPFLSVRDIFPCIYSCPFNKIELILPKTKIHSSNEQKLNYCGLERNWHVTRITLLICTANKDQAFHQRSNQEESCTYNITK